MTGKLLTYHLKSPRIPLVVRVPQFENHWFTPYVTLYDEPKAQFGCGYLETAPEVRDHRYQCCYLWYFNMTANVMFSDKFLMPDVLATNLMLTVFFHILSHFRTTIS